MNRSDLIVARRDLYSAAQRLQAANGDATPLEHILILDLINEVRMLETRLTRIISALEADNGQGND